MTRNKSILKLTLILCLLALIIQGSLYAQKSSKTYSLIPENGAINVSPDTHLKLIFRMEPVLGNSGKIRIYDMTSHHLVDSLDLSIPAGPTIPNKNRVPYTPTPYEYISGNFTNANTKPGTPSGSALPTPDNYQLTIIGGFTDAFHFYPIIIHDTVATIYPHNNLLDYNKTYYIQIDPGVLNLSDESFTGIKDFSGWIFTTKKSPPAASAQNLVVSADGDGDFSTVQGAVDFIPDYDNNRVTIFIKNGIYEEIVYFRNKTNITFVGEDRDDVVVCYANNEVFNPHPSNISTNEWPGTFPSRRAVFMGDNSSGIDLVNLTIRSINENPAQAEGLLLMGSENIICDVNVYGSGDALQVNGSVYLMNSRITGFGDNILGRGPAFFNNCERISSSGPHMWIRNTEKNHGNVFLNCTFKTDGDGETVIARAPSNHGFTYPYCEAVLLNCALEGIKPEGWGPVGGDISNVHYWEYNSRNLIDGKPADVSQRDSVSRQLTMEKDSLIIANYSNPTYVLGGWTPEMAPLVLNQPRPVKIKKGEIATFRVKVAAVPQADFQWYKNGKSIPGENKSFLEIKQFQKDDAAFYKVIVSNGAGSASSEKAQLVIE